MRYLILFAIIAAANSLSDWDLWLEFKTTHGKSYQNLQEEKLRYQIFQENLRKIEEHNAKYELGEVTYYLGINQFVDKTHHEYLSMLRFNKQNKPDVMKISSFKIPENFTLPKSVDWRKKHVVTNVKYQGYCASCWAFSATGAMESQYAIKHNTLISLSEQNLLDCSTKYGNGDCAEGGIMRFAFNYVKDNGINSDYAYPYEFKEGPCRFNKDKVILKLSGFEVIEPNEEALQYAVAINGPVSVAIDFDDAGFYAGGIFNNPNCKQGIDEINHGVLVVGYGSENGIDYWIVKNSWGLSYGEDGYIRMIRNANNQCGIVDDAARPLVI